MLRPKSKSCHLSAAGELRPCAAYSDPSVRESPVFPNRKLRECAAFACSCGGGRPGNPVPSHSLSNTIFLYTDIGRTRSGGFSSAAPRLIAPPFFNTSFFIFGERKSRQVSKQRNPYFRRAQQPAGGSPFFRHLRMIFHNSMLYSLNGHEYSPVPSVLSSHCKHGLSVRMVEFLSCFSGGVCPSCVSKLRLIHGGRFRRAFARMIPDSVRARARAYRSPFFRHLFTLIFRKIKIFSRNGRGNIRPFPSVRSSHCKHGLSVRMSQSLLTFSGGVRPAAANGIQGVRPSFLRLYEQFFMIR